MSLVSAEVQARSAACKQEAPPLTPTCGPSSLVERSYRIPARWPLPSMQLVMEEVPKTCDYYRANLFVPCCSIVHALEHIMERQIREVIVSFLSGCGSRARPRCRAADFGGNNGWMSMAMLALGANVTSVEPASDLAEAIRLSGELNCWADRHAVVNAFACEGQDRGPRACMRFRRGWQGYRAGGGGPEGLRERLKETPGRTVADILTSPSLARKAHPEEIPHYDLIKLDGDGPEGGWMRAIDSLLTARAISVGAITLEGNNVDPGTMSRYQREHGFVVYRLDIGDPRRHVNRNGWDALSPQGTPMGRLPRVPRDRYEREVFGLRAMRHLWRAADNLTAKEWRVLLGPLTHYNPNATVSNKWVHQWVLTTERTLAEPVVPPRSRGRRYVEHSAASLDGGGIEAVNGEDA